MKKASELPLAVNNLRKVWEAKKAEMKFTQVQAAKELGWSQGAISHYLNNITELGPSAVIKFANFLDVDPIEIDPSITEHLPNVRTREIRYDISNLKKPLKQKTYTRIVEKAYWVSCKASDFSHFHLLENCEIDFSGHYYLLVCPPKESPECNLLLVKLHNRKRAKIIRAEDKPKDSEIERVLAILEVSITDPIGVAK